MGGRIATEISRPLLIDYCVMIIHWQLCSITLGEVNSLCKFRAKILRISRCFPSPQNIINYFAGSSPGFKL